MKKTLVIPAVILAIGLMVAIERHAANKSASKEVISDETHLDGATQNNTEETTKTAEKHEPFLIDQIEKEISKNKEKKARGKGELHQVTEQLDKAVAADAARYYENQ